VVIGNIYRNPGAQLQQFCESLCSSIEILNRSKTKYVLLGDTNIDLTKFNLVSSITNYVNSLFSVGCTFHIDKPTRISSSSATCIDHVYSNLQTEFLDNYIVLSDVSDHFGIITKLWCTVKEYCNEPMYYRKSRLNDKEWEQFNNDLKLMLSPKLSSCVLANYDVNVSAEIITSAYHELIEKYMPKRKLNKKQTRFRNKPWITRGMKISINTKNFFTITILLVF